MPMKKLPISGPDAPPLATWLGLPSLLLILSAAPPEIRAGDSSRGAGTGGMMSTLENEFLVVDSNDAREPRVGLDATGRAVFVYTDRSTDTVQWIAFDENGSPLTTVSPLSTTAATEEAPDVAVRADGSFYAVWRSDEVGGSHLRGRFSDATDGLGPSDTAVSDLQDPVSNGLESGGIASLAAGGFATVWESHQTHQTGEDVDGSQIQGQRIDAGGSVAGTPQIHVNDVFTHLSQRLPDVAPTLDGGFFAVWETYFSTGYEIHARRFLADGTPVGSEFRVETTTTGGQHDPRVAANGSGEILVVWTAGEDPNVIRGRLFDADLVPIGDDFPISSRTDVVQQFPDVAGGAEHFVVGWARSEGDWDVLARVVRGHAAFDGPAFQVNSWDPPHLRHDEVGVGAFGDRAIVTWQGEFDETSGLHSIGALSIRLCGLFCDGFESGDTLAW